MTNGYDIRIDVAKGIGMLLLVIGHLLTIDSTGFKIIFGFHMPLFFFLSGYLFTGSKYSVSDFFSKKVSKLIISYLFFTIIGVLFYILLSGFSIQSIKHLLISTIYWGEPSVNNNLWFLSTLICVMTIFYFIPALSSPRLKSYYIILVIAICLILSFTFDLIPQKYIPLKLYTVPLAFIFFFIGNRFTTDRCVTQTVKICLFLGGGNFASINNAIKFKGGFTSEYVR